MHTWYDETLYSSPHKLEWETVSWMQTWTLNDLNWGPHYIVVYARRTKQTLASTIVTKVPAWIRQRAAELLKKQIASYTKTYWNFMSQASVMPYTPAWILDTWRTAHAHLHPAHTHTCSQPLVGLHTDWQATQITIYMHTFVTFLQMHVTPPMSASSSLYNIPMQALPADSNFMQELKV